MKEVKGRHGQRGSTFTQHALLRQREQWLTRLRRLLHGAYADLNVPKRPRTGT